MGFFSKLRTILGKTDDVLSSPYVAAVVGAVPGGTIIAPIVHAANKVFPQAKAGDRRLEAVLDALQVKHPEIDRNDALFSIEQIVAAINSAGKAKAAAG